MNAHRTGLVCALVFMAAAAARAQNVPGLADSARHCAVCHLEWNESFRRPGAILLMEAPPGPVVAVQDTCLGCHDGGVGDSRRRVWQEHGHQTGMVPPPGMTVPAELPLSDGKVQCRTCHTAHTRSGPQTIETAVFLRMNNDRGQLCSSCHAEYAGGSEKGHHPTPQMKQAIPRELLAGYARAGAEGNQVTCQTCHTPHGSGEDHLLVLSPKNNALCLGCHQTLDPGIWDQHAGMDHSRPVKLGTPERRQAIERMGTHAGPDDTLICLSCHRVHKGAAGRSLLAASPSDSSLCAGCHSEQAPLLGSAHDMTVTAPQARSVTDQPVQQAGACSACHASHRRVEPKVPQPERAITEGPDRLCASCHHPAGLAPEKPVSLLRHPTGPATGEAATGIHGRLPLYNLSGEHTPDGFVACASCHDPHADSRKAPGLLRGGPEAAKLCVECHADPARLHGGLHDSRQHPSTWPEDARKANDLCLSCHQPHSNSEEHGLWTVKPDPHYAIEDGACLGCHQHLEWGGHGRSGHSTGAATQPASGVKPAYADPNHGLPLVPTAPGRTSGAIGCKTCHDPHAPPGEQPHLLRPGRTLDPGAMCLSCHSELQYIGMSLHNREAMREYAKATGGMATEITSCGPCHNVHAPGGTSSGATQPAPGAGHLPKDVQRCIGCHSEGGGARSIAVFDHFPQVLQNVSPPGTPGFMPLVNERGAISESGRIGCVTCHMPHGRPPGPAMPVVDPAKIGTEQLRSMMPMVSPFTPPNLCTSCHGFEGLVRYLYFHDPEKRKAINEEQRRP